MSDLVGSLTTELRITGRIFRETGMGLKRTGLMNIIIVVIMASILSIFGALLAVIIEMGVLVQNLGSEVEISVYIKDEANTQQVRDEIMKLPHIKKLTLISKEKAWAEMQKEYPLPDVENPLPDTIHMQMTSEKHILTTVEKLKSLPGVETLQYPKEVLDKISKITQGASIVGMSVSFILAMLTMFIINNTIHLLIQNKRREIEILRMMGVGNWYIRLPFLLQGALYGVVSALVACGAVYFAVEFLNQVFITFQLQTNESTSNIVYIILVLMGLLVGGGGAAIAVRKYLQV